jgi:hypothetical protein
MTGRPTRRSMSIAGTVAALVLSGTIIGDMALAGQGDRADPADYVPPTTTQPLPTEPTGTTVPPPPTTTTDPTSTTIDPTTTTIDPTSTTIDPTSTTIDPTTTPTTTTTEPPPPCVDPGPQPPGEGPPSDDPAVGPSGGSSVNDQLIEVGGRILNLFYDNNYPGFAGVVADVDQALLTLYWLAGEALPPEIADIVADPGQPILVVREDASWSRAQLEVTAQSLLDNPTLNDQICGFLHTIVIREQGSGLTTTVEPYDASFDAALAEQILTSAAGVPVSVEVGPQSEYAGRVNDTAPWFAGGRTTSGGGSCSTAFGIVDAGTRTREYMLTALHCAPVGAQVSNGNGTAVLGPVTHARPQWDSELIRVTQAGTDTFFGGVNGVGAPETNAPVRRPAANVAGTTFACTSGASTGENCALRVNATNVDLRRRVWIGGRIFVVGEVNMVIASSTVRRPNGQLAVAVGSGDSGGPVVTDTSMDRQALGTISAGFNFVGCGLFAAPRKWCGSSVVYADINILLRSYVAAMR